MYKLDGQDSYRGVARFNDVGKAVIDWPDYADDPINRFAAERLKQWADKVGGTVVPNVAGLPGMRSFSVHPLGGCRMGKDIKRGVCNDVGQIFSPKGGVYPGLRIADASLIPTSLGVPPSLTVAALAEKVSASLVEEILAERAGKP
jgi:cholesterol oxidase